MSTEQILKELRKQWVKQPHNRKSIELVVEMIKNAPEYIEAENPFVSNVKKALL